MQKKTYQHKSRSIKKLMPKEAQNPDFDETLDTCVSHIDMQTVLHLVELLDRDELGVRIFEMALQICKEYYFNENLSFEFMRMNTGGTADLATNPYVRDKYFARIYPWNKLQKQNPDGLYLIKMKQSLKNKVRAEYVVQYESDGNDKSNEPMPLVHKIMQGIDLLASFHEKNDYQTLTSYAVRGNISSMLLEKERPNATIYWLHNFVRSHIKTVLIMMQHMAFPADKQTKLHHKEKNLKMHYCFFVGAFDIIHNKNEYPFRSKSIEDYLPSKQIPVLKSEEMVLDFQKVTIEERQAFMSKPEPDGMDNLPGFGTTLPFPLMPLLDEDDPDGAEAIELLPKVLDAWSIQSKLYMFLSDNYEVQCLGFEIGQIFLPPAELPDFKDHAIQMQGLITVSTVLEFIASLFNNYADHHRQQIIDASFEGDWFKDGIVTRVKEQVDTFFSHHSNRERKITLENSYNIVAFINSIIFYTQFLLFWSFGAQFNKKKKLILKGISWKVQNYDKTRFERIAVDDDNDGLLDLKMRIRNDPHFQKKRQNNEFLNKGYEKGGSLKGRIMCSLNNGLPKLSNDVEKYLNQYKIPHAYLFCRILRVPSVLALREMARQAGNYGEIDDQYQSIIKLLPVGTQSEINFMFEKLRNEVDFFVNGDDVAASDNEITDLDFVQQILQLFEIENTIQNTIEILEVLQNNPSVGGLGRTEKKDIVQIMQSLQNIL